MKYQSPRFSLFKAKRIAYGMPEKRNFSCRITPRRKEEGGNVEGKSVKKGRGRDREKEREREREREREKEEWRERHFTRTGGSHALPSISISMF